MIGKYYSKLHPLLAGLFLLLPAAPLHAAPLYRPSGGEAVSFRDLRAFEAGTSVLGIALLLGMIRQAKKHRENLSCRSMLEAIPCDVALLDKKGKSIEVLRGGITGPGLEKGAHLGDAFPEECANRILSAVRETFATGMPATFDYSVDSANEQRWYEGNTLRIANKVLFVNREITSRKIQEIACLSEKERYRSILQSIRNGVITTDLEGRITYLNPEAEKLTGWKHEKAFGSAISEVFRIFVESSREPAENPALKALRESSASAPRNNLLLVRKDGAEFGIDESAAPVMSQGKAVGAVIVFHDISDSKHLLWQAGHDALTGLLNRVLLHDRLIHSMASVKRQGNLLAVLFIDLDGFKTVNDNLGHTAGDLLLKEVAQRLKKAIRAEDTAARIGGDEFVVLQESSDRNEVKSCLDRIMGTMRPPFDMDGIVVNVSLSIGVVLYPENDAEPETLLRQADMAMYHAKQAGRDQYHFFDARMDISARETHERQLRIESALKNGEFCLYYQPKINIQSGSIVGFEALIRWNNPDNEKIVLPSDFLPTIQDSQLIVEIGNWVIDRALEQISAWKERGIETDISVNVASRQLHDPDFLSTLKTTLLSHPQVKPSNLELEILETTAIADFHRIQQVLSGCREIGVRLSLDDFGTGYASLSYLKNLPVDRLKIDRSFVSEMFESKDNLAIIRSIVSMSKIFDREVLAEGLESPMQGRTLIQMGCKLAQGFGIAEPMPGEQIPEWIGNWQENERWMEKVH